MPVTPEQPARDALFLGASRLATWALLSLLLAILLTLVIGAWPALVEYGPSFLATDAWNPVEDVYGGLGALLGTIVTAVIAMIVGVPVAFGVAIFLTELCPWPLRRPIGTAIELLAAVPSIIYGIWGLFVLAPVMQSTVQPALAATLGQVPGLGRLFSGPPLGIGMLTAGLILAIMILPIVTTILRDVFQTVPPIYRESAYGLGATTWEVVWHVVLPYSRTGAAGAVLLGLGRALGETMAVTFVIGNAHHIKASLFAPGTTIASTLANEFTEAVGDLYTGALIELGLVLFGLTVLVLGAARWLLARTGLEGKAR